MWWGRFAQPDLHAWAAEGEPTRLVEREPDKKDPDPKASACYGLFREAGGRTMLRFVDGRPVGTATCDFPARACGGLAAGGREALLLAWDNAAWHVSEAVRAWVKAHDAEAKRTGGVRVVVCRSPVKAPWLNPIEPKWVHGERATAQPGRKSTADELKQRICDYYGRERLKPLAPKVA